MHNHEIAWSYALNLEVVLVKHCVLKSPYWLKGPKKSCPSFSLLGASQMDLQLRDVLLTYQHVKTLEQMSNDKPPAVPL